MFAFDQSQDLMPVMAWRTAAVGLWMAIWWATEAIPVPVTALLPMIVFGPLGIASVDEAFPPYAHPIIFLFLGGFMMALAVERWNLHRRISLAILERTGTDGRRLVGGFMFVCALLSMWMTNTSTTMMLLPIVLSVIAVIRENVGDVSEQNRSNFQIAMLIGIAYAASIGGLATIIGTPPNAFLVGHLADNYQIEISFARWMLVGLPVTAVMLPLAWLLLTRFIFRFDIPASGAVQLHLHKLREEMGPVTTPEKRVAIIFGAVILCWMLRRPVTDFFDLDGISDTNIVLAAVVLLMMIPSGDSTQPRLMTWHEVTRVPWGVLILFGGGLSLAAAVQDTGLALWLGESLSPLNAWGTAVLVLASVTLVIFLTELTSNLATTATLVPVMGAIAIQAGLPPIYLMVPITIAASCAFMLPVATPPNAIIFATGTISIPQLAKAGFWLNVIGIIIVTIVSLIVAPAALG
jgi:sodium-dependent dicarboxylate transporter 2/3/5